jgi:hypothetical protein
MSVVYLKAFNNCFEEHILFIVNLFPNNTDLRSAYNGLISIKKINPALIVKFWYSYIVENYKEPIEKEDYEYFLTKEYKHDILNVSTSNYSDKIIEGIEKMKKPVSEMNVENKIKWIKYMKQLNQLSTIYNISKN